MTQTIDLQDRVAIVTGASRGLGFALAGGLAAAGYQLIIDARDGAALEAAAAEIRAQHDLPRRAVRPLPGDITDASHRYALAAAAAEQGGASLLVNNAGTLGASPLPPLAGYPPAALLASFEVNVVAPVALTQLVLPDLRRRGGAVMSVTSDAAVEASFDLGSPGVLWSELRTAFRALARRDITVPIGIDNISAISR